MDRVCIDASLAGAWLSWETHTLKANALRQEWQESGVEMVAPALFHVEVVSTIRKRVYLKLVPPNEGEEAFFIYLDMPVKIIDGPEITQTAWDLAKEYNLPVCYDMFYLAVAELMQCTFWTNDKKLVNSLNGKNRRVKYLGDYHTRGRNL